MRWPLSCCKQRPPMQSKDRRTYPNSAACSATGLLMTGAPQLHFNKHIACIVNKWYSLINCCWFSFPKMQSWSRNVIWSFNKKKSKNITILRVGQRINNVYKHGEEEERAEEKAAHGWSNFLSLKKNVKTSNSTPGLKTSLWILGRYLIHPRVAIIA